MISLLAIAMGGALGAMARHGVSMLAVLWAGYGFPWGTLSVNIIGSFLMGALITMLAHWGDELPAAFRNFAVTGFLGAFTTFSTFSLDAVTLWERGEIIPAALYVGASVVISLAALIAGMALVRSLPL